ncbi:hypothetical protein EMIT0194P_20532 [Pseudomonas serbica]
MLNLRATNKSLLYLIQKIKPFIL